MTFKTTRRSFDSNFKSRNETGFTSRSSKLQSRPRFGNEQGYFIFVLKTPVTNGIQKTDMRSKLQQRIDSSRLFERTQNNNLQPGLATRKEIVAVKASDLYWDALSIMNGCMDAALLKTDIAERILKLPPSRFLRVAGRTTGVAGLFFSGLDVVNNPTFGNWAKLGVGAVFVGLAICGSPVLVTAATVGNIGMIDRKSTRLNSSH